MGSKECVLKLWGYLQDAFDESEILAAVEECSSEEVLEQVKALDALSEDDAKGLLFDLSYMAANGLFGGDLHTWNEVLCYSLGFDEETLEYLDF